MNDRTELLRGIHTNPAFIWISRNLRFIEVDGVKIGVVRATRNPRFPEHALNVAETERLLTSKRAGKVHEAFVVFASTSESYQYVVTGHQDAEQLHQKILAMGLQPRPGAYGPFWVLPSILTMGDNDIM